MSYRSAWFWLRELPWRLREAPKAYRYGGWRAVLPWVLRGENSDWEE